MHEMHDTTYDTPGLSPNQHYNSIKFQI
jgi:hypothetical protein